MLDTSKYNELLKQVKPLNDEQLSQLFRYYEMLDVESRVMNLTTITEFSDVYVKHFYDSLLVLKEQNVFDNATLIDVGSGAGFPGLVLKIAYPNMYVTLLEPTKKRCDFLNKIIEELSLQKIEVVNKRAEEYILDKRESYDFVAARAVSNMNILSELTIPFAKIGGKFLAMKGQNYHDECQEIGDSIHKLGGKITKIYQYELPENAGKRVVIEIEKAEKTPIIYPRSFAKIKKRPLK